MLSRIVFKKSLNLDAALTNYTDIYQIQSMIRGVVYGIDKQKFAIIGAKEAYFCPICEMPKIANKFIPTVRDEILGIYKDVSDLRRMEVAI